jgi:hypothetical protein
VGRDVRSDISDYNTGLNGIFDSDIIRNKFQISTRFRICGFDLIELPLQKFRIYRLVFRFIGLRRFGFGFRLRALSGLNFIYMCM